MKEKPLIIANPNSENLTTQEISIVEDILGVKVNVTGSFGDLERVLIDHKDAPAVGIMGGDGTVMRTRTFVEDIWSERPAYIFFPNGTMNNVQGALGLKRSTRTTIKLAGYAAAELKKSNPRYASLASIAVNEFKGFNTGVGIPPKLLWMDYGHSAIDFLNKQASLRRTEKVGLENIGKLDDKSTFRAIWKIYTGLDDSRSDEYELFSQPIYGDIILDGQSWDENKRRPLGIYMASYEEVNFGFPFWNPKPSPGARAVESKLEVVAPYGYPEDIKGQLFRVARGKRMADTLYQHVTKVEVPDQRIAQVCGEIITAYGFTMEYDGKVKVLTPFSN